MKILLLSCSTGEGHNHCALAVKEALDARGHETSFLDMLHMFGAPGPLSFDKILNRISTKAPDVFGMMYHAGAMYSATGVTSPVYMANIRHARQLNAYIRDNGYDAVVCSHLFPMETLTFLRRWERCEVKCCGILSDYMCIPFLAETDLDAYFLPHSEVRELCIQAGMPAEKLIVSGMPVAARFLAPMDKAAARAALGLPADKKIYLIMTGGIGCGDAVSLCDAIRRVPDENALLCVLPGRNEALRQALEDAYHGQGVLTVPFIGSLETAETVTLAVSPTLMPVNTSSATETCTSTAPFSAITTLGCAEDAMPPRSTFTAVTVPEHGAVTVPRLACLLI